MPRTVDYDSLPPATQRLVLDINRMFIRMAQRLDKEGKLPEEWKKILEQGSPAHVG